MAEKWRDARDTGCVCVCVAGNWRDARDTGLCVCGVCFLFSQVLGLRVYIASVETVSSG